MRIKAIILTGASLIAAPLFAQTAPSSGAPPLPDQTAPAASGVEDIVVTAQRREERLQDVPIAITAVSSARLTAAGVTSSTDLGVVTPGLTVASTQNYFQPRIRGIGTQAFGPGLENPIATYVDGIYIASAPGSLLSLGGIERIEVLKGPQGTLFGRNATGGLIQVVTRDPRAGFSGNADVSYGNYRTAYGDLYVTGGSEKVAADLAIHYSHQGEGYGRNYVLNQDTNRQTNDLAVRSKILTHITDTTTARLSFDYARSNGSFPTAREYAGAQPLLGPQTPGGPWDADNDTATRNQFEGGGVGLRVDQEFGDVRLVSLTGYRRSNYNYDLDFDATRTPGVSVFNIQNDRQFSQELQLTSRPGSHITWLVGAYYFYGKGSFDPANIVYQGPLLSPSSPIFPLDDLQYRGGQTAKSIAVFGQATLPLGDRTNLTGGVRYTSEKRALDVTQTVYLLNGLIIPTQTNASSRYKSPSWRVSLDHKITPDLMVYASYNRGFKSGGYNVTTPQEPQYGPEKLDAFEVGAKAEFFNRVIRINPSVFYYNYSNIQVQYFTPQGQIGVQTGPSARIYGLDVDFEFVPTRYLRFFGGATALSNHFGSYPNAPTAIPLPIGGNFLTTGDATHNQLPFTARFTGNVGAEYKIPVGSGQIAVNANLYHSSRFFSEADNRLRQPAYEQLSASIGWSSSNDRLSVRGWAKNLTNKAVVTQLSSGPFGVGASYQPPRTYGVTLGTKF